MNGWLIIFAVTSMSSGFWGHAADAPAGFSGSILFGLLFLIALGTRVVRGEAC
jgi:hypothetical protein